MGYGAEIIDYPDTNKRAHRNTIFVRFYIDGLVQETRNSFTNALELSQSYTNPSICDFSQQLLLKEERNEERKEGRTKERKKEISTLHNSRAEGPILS